jgi:archaellin
MMLSHRRTFLTGLMVCGLLALPSAQAGKHEPYMKFIGSFDGNTEITLSDGQKAERDLSVVVEETDDGFNINWKTTTIRSSGRTKTKSYSIDFIPTKRENIYSSAMKPNIFGGREALDPMKGDPYVWARITGDTLTVFALVISDDGDFEMQRYDRTLSKEGIDLKFVRLDEEGVVKEITGKLTRK